MILLQNSFDLTFDYALHMSIDHTPDHTPSTQVEEKPDVTYNDVGGCKEQIEKLKEVVETPLLHVSHQTPIISVTIPLIFVTIPLIFVTTPH